MILDIDIGNSRIKWRIKSSDGSVPAKGAADAARVRGFVSALGGYPLRRIRVACVAGAPVADALTSACRSQLGIAPEFAAVADGMCGLHLAYRNPSKMGVDRWLAMLAGRRRSAGACVVLDAGTAVTADLVDGAGLHAGGLIAPGVPAMRDALGRRTSGVQTAALTLPQKWRPGSDTLSCVENGVAAALAGFAAEVAKAARARFGPQVSLLACGGDAALVAGYCPDYEVVPDLVLDGLALAMD